MKKLSIAMHRLNVFFSYLKYFLVEVTWSYSCFQDRQSIDHSLENQITNRLIAMAAEKNSKQIIISMNSQDQVDEFKGNLSKGNALKELEGAMLQEESLTKEWLPHDLASFPQLQIPLSELIKCGETR